MGNNQGNLGEEKLPETPHVVAHGLWEMGQHEEKTLLSQFTFYLRYYFKDTFGSELFRLPVRGGPYPDEFRLLRIYRENLEDKTIENAWKHLVSNRLESMTACGHFADQLTWKIFFPSKQQSKKSLQLHNIVDLNEKLDQFMKLLEKEDSDKNNNNNNTATSYLVRVEINDSHVYLLNIPRLRYTDDTQFYAYMLESSVFQYDSRVVGLKKESLFEHLDLLRTVASSSSGGETIEEDHVLWKNRNIRTVDLFDIYKYSEDEALEEFKTSLDICFSQDNQLVQYPYYDKTKSWKDIRQLVSKFNSIAMKQIEERVVGEKLIWTEIQKYISTT
eukprot:TRINITY_DN8307_c0_g1_i1.p1 TRINITY_DN8307_c0_g1~~TRINITY_DN8307_c0_g1_i1.p1  ORF type:complete len:331 (+),score=58.57 TRINITY_DN8307_c0_g1_i1:96-1088(+)